DVGGALEDRQPAADGTTIAVVAIVGHGLRQEHGVGKDRVVVALGRRIEREGVVRVANAAGEPGFVVGDVAPAFHARRQHGGIFAVAVVGFADEFKGGNGLWRVEGDLG